MGIVSLQVAIQWLVMNTIQHRFMGAFLLCAFIFPISRRKGSLFFVHLIFKFHFTHSFSIIHGKKFHAFETFNFIVARVSENKTRTQKQT